MPACGPPGASPPAALFESVLAGDADFAFQLVDSYYSRNPDGTYSDNSTEAFLAVTCLDYSAESAEDPADEAARAISATGSRSAARCGCRGPRTCSGWTSRHGVSSSSPAASASRP